MSPLDVLSFHQQAGYELWLRLLAVEARLLEIRRMLVRGSEPATVPWSGIPALPAQPPGDDGDEWLKAYH
ncbi:MAG TPA: hypothetical protein VM681_10660 [Candidatus Thermoplasmatota archaeon]|nr:hypothetical protein [Candidatus Thermoplasmatota archaeon]